ncbi:hypothetical protein MJ560_09360 [Klebsiella pneumoniae]|nr:hypothetical protein MJ560_09360 [Klebsiella pneumoniae]
MTELVIKISPVAYENERFPGKKSGIKIFTAASWTEKGNREFAECMLYGVGAAESYPLFSVDNLVY